MFVDFKNLGDVIIALINPADSLVLVAGFQSVVAAWFIAYIVYIGVLTLLGKQEAPGKEIIYKAIAIAVISAFAFNIGNYYTLAINAVNGLSTWASGGGAVTIYADLDAGLVKIDKLHEVFIKKDNYFRLVSTFSIGIVYIGYYAFALVTTAMLVLNSLVLQLVIFTFPIAVVTLFFPMVKAVFGRWLELAIANILTILFISKFFRQIWTTMSIKIDAIILSANSVETITVAFSLAGLFVMGLFLIFVGIIFAEKLTSVSAESIPGSVGAKGAKGAASAAKSAGKGAVNAKNLAVGKSFGKKGGKLGGVAGAAKDVGAKAHSLYKGSKKK